MELLEKTIFKNKNKEIALLQRRLDIKTRDYETVFNELKEQNTLTSNLKQQLDDLNKISAESISKVMMENTKLKDEVKQKELARRKNAGAIGGLSKMNKKLIAENAELANQLETFKKEFEEYKKNKFIIKEIKPQKVPKKTQIMGIKSGTKTSKIIAKVKPVEIEEG